MKKSTKLFALICWMGLLAAFLFLPQCLVAQTCPGGLGTTVNIASLPYNGTGLTTCGAGNEITSSNATICGSSSYYGGEDLVFIFTPSASGSITISLTSSSSWIGLMLYSGCPFTGQGGICVGSTQSSAGSKTLTVTVTSGVTYYLVVDTWPAPTCIPSFSLSIPAPATTDPCASITTLTCGTAVSSTLSGTGVWDVTACGFNTPGQEKVFSFTPATTGAYSLQVNTTAGAGYIDYFYKAASGGCSSTGWTCIVDTNDPGTFPIGTLTAGVQYYILLDPEGTASVTHNFQINCLAANPCASITTLACATPATATLVGTGVWNSSTCFFSTPGQEKVYSFTPTTTGTHTLQVTSASGTGYMDYQYKAASGGCSATGWTCIDDINFTTSVNFGPLTAGVQYYILLDAESTTSSTQTFQINCPTPFDPCTSITPLACATAVSATPSGTGVWNNNTCLFSTPGQEKIYSFTPSVTGSHSIQVNSVAGGYIDYMYKAASGGCSATGWTCIDDINFTGTYPIGTLTAGVEYYILLDPEFTGSYNHNFQVVCAAPPVVLTCPTNTTTAACQTQAAVNSAFDAWLATASGSGGCGGVLTNNNTGAPPACGGSTTVTFTYTSSCAPLTTTCNATFTVSAPASPTPVFANCTNNTVNLGCNPFNLPTCAGIAGGGFGGAVTASNSCGSVPVSCSAGSITINGCTRTQIFTFEATACGQTVTCTRTFTWNVVTPPSFGGTCGNGVVNLGCNPTTLPACDPNITASNECGSVPVTCNVGAITVNGCNRSQQLTYTANAAGCGTFSTCVRIFNWQVTTPPVFSNCDNTIDLGCNPATLPSCANINQAGFGGAITATNECGNLSINCSAGAITTNGCNRTQVFTLSATGCGQTTTCTRTFTWQVVTAPVFSNCTSDTTDLGCNPAVLPSCDPSITASSECGAATVICTAGAMTQNGCGRTQVFTYVATGGCGLTTTCSRTFTWTVDPSATLNCPSNQTVAACQTQAAVNGQFATWLATASFGGGCNAVLTNNNTGAPPFCGGSTTVTFTLTTACQAPQTCQATFTVTAAPTPQLTCPNPLIRPVCQTRAQDSIAMQNWVNTSSFGGGCNGSINFNGFDGRPPSSCGGTKTLTLTYFSSCAAPLTCTSTFTIPAPTAPVLTCPTNTSVPFGQTQAQVNAAFATWLATASGTGGCNGVLSNNNTGAPPATGGSTTVTFTYSQNPPSTPFNGACPFSTLTCQATFTVSATPPAVLTCPVNTTTAACQTQAAVNAAFSTWLATASGTGGCNGVLTNNNTGAPPACGGSTTVTFTYTSTCAPLTTNCQATFTVAAAPTVVLTCPTNTTAAACQTQAAVNSAFATWLATASASGGCNGVLTNNNTGAPSACGGSTTVTFTYTSSCAPLTTTCQATFTVAAAPTVVLTCPTNTTVAACQTQDAVNTAFATWLSTASASGGCNGVLTNNNTGAPSACGGSTTVTFTYTSSCAPLTTTCQATFTVAAAPTVVLTCPVNTTTAACQTQDAVNTAFATWLVTASASGGCNGVLTNNNTGAPSACGGSTTVTFTYTSSCVPLTMTCQATFTVAAAPTVVLTCPVNTTTAACQTQAAVDTAFATWLATASASGGCNGVLTNNNTGAPSACGGSTTVTFTYTSSCAPLTTTCQATFTVTAAPTVVLTCPTNTTAAACQTQAAVNTAFATWLATASASGGCNGVLTNNNTGAPSACGGSTTVTFTYTSSCAPLTTTCQATFTVTAAPTVVLTCPTNTTAAACQTQAAVNTAFATWLATASASGGCNGVLTNNNTGAPSACGGSTTVTFTYTSSCAPTTTTCTATFTVAAPPTVVLTCPTNTTAAACQTQADVNTAFATWLATASGSGGCNGVLTNDNTGAPSACGGSTTVTFTYTSSCAPLTTTCQATFTVTAAPTVVLTCPQPTTASACLTQAQLNAAYAAWLATATATGGCNGVLTNNAPAAPSICNPNASTTTVTFTYTSSCVPTTTTCQSTFTVPAYPTYSVPANGAAQVACPALIVQPTPPVVVDGCGKTLTPTGPVITNNPNPITCEGTRTYTWTYTDCAGLVRTWTHVTTVERQPFSVPANGSATVACPDQTDAQPTAPVVLSNCGEVLTPVVTSTAKPGCEGNRNWNFTYTDCEGNTATWTFIYTVEYLEFNVPPSETLTVDCPLNAIQPTPPTVLDNCGKTLMPIGPAITSTNNAGGCEASRSYTWTYKDCEGTTKTWSRLYNFAYTADFFVYPDGEVFVGCLLFAQPPVPPTIYDNCGQEIKVAGPTITGDVSDCSGIRKYTYVYTNCGGFSHPWSFTYFAGDNEPPIGNCPGGSLANSVDVTNLSCPSDVPCPDTYDFSSKVQELLAAGNISDVCSGDDLVVELDSWTALWDCADPDGDGQYTFGRTFYFRIADQCGNEMPSLCGVTYSGACLPLETFPQGAWGNVGGEPGSTLPGNDTTDLQVISTLLAQGPLTIGGANRSITLTDAQCVENLLPGIGNPGVLSNCQQVNCTGCNSAGPLGMKNILAANTIALTLNMRFNVQYNGVTMNAVRNQGLGCIAIDQNLKICAEGGGCKLRIYESNGTVQDFPYTIGGLLDLANLYLNGGLVLSAAQSSVYAAALNNSITNVNAYWHSSGPAIACDPGAGANAQDDSVAKSLPTGQPSIGNAMTFSLAPNPAGNEVTLKLSDMVGEQEVSVEIYNQLGQRVLVRKLGQVAQVNERIDLTGIGSGLYIVSVRAGGERFEQKLVVSKD